MAIKKITPQEAVASNPQCLIAFDNGDFTALTTIVAEWGFKDTESALKFAIAVLLLTRQEKAVKVKVNPGDKDETAVTPAVSLLKPAATNPSSPANPSPPTCSTPGGAS